MRLPKQKTHVILGSRNVFTISLIVIGLTIIGVYFWGLGSHHTFFENSIISTTILSLAFFLFISISLYNGVRLKNDMGRLTDKIEALDLSSIPDVTPSADVDVDVGDGCGEAILAAILWVIVAFFLSIILWFFGQIVWLILISFTAML
jgi:hypothetical protein